MIYLTQMLGKPVLDASGTRIGKISDVAIATHDVFPRVTALAFVGAGNQPFMLSWRKFVEGFDNERVTLNADRPDLRFSYLQPEEVLLSRDLLGKEIVDTQGNKVVRVQDLELSESKNQLRLLGAEVGLRGMLRGFSPSVESLVTRLADAVNRPIRENLIAWNYMDLLDRDLSHVKLSVTHRRLHELHPADVADILEQLSPSRRAIVFERLGDAQAAGAISELQDDLQAGALDGMTDERASDVLEQMDPDDAADVIADLPYDKAETLLRLMGLKEQSAIRRLLGYKESSAGGIMKSAFGTVTADMTVQGVIDYVREHPSVTDESQFLYVVRSEEDRRLDGRVSLRDIITASPETPLREIVSPSVRTVGPDDDQEHVAETMSKYDLLSVPVVDESGLLLGVVTLDDVIEIVQSLRAANAREVGKKGAPADEPDILLQVANVPPAQALSVMESSAAGLSAESAARRLEQYGPNSVTRQRRVRWYTQLVSAFANPFNGILVVLALVSYVTDVRIAERPDYTKIIILTVMVTASGLVRFFQEYRSAKAAAGLQSIIRTTATILRQSEGTAPGPETPQELLSPDSLRKAEERPVEELVPGDIVFLHAGDMVPADLRLLLSRDLFIAESSLTGESLPVEKHAYAPGRSLREMPTSALEADSLCFMGTNVTSGSAAAVVVATGASTYLGSLGQALSKAPEPTAFDRGVSRVSWVLVGFMLAMTPVVFVVNWLTKGSALGALLFALAVAVGLTPEMLPMIVSTNLARGSIRLSKHKVIVKQVSAIQNLGAIDVLCTDKTGTLTEDHVVLERHIDLNGQDSPDVLQMAHVNSYFQTGLRNLLDDAVITFANKAEIDRSVDRLEKVDEIAFDFSRKRLSIVVRDPDGKERLVCKGAAEDVLAVSTVACVNGAEIPLSDSIRSDALARVRELNEKGMRVLAVAYRDLSQKKRTYSVEDENDLVLVGLLGFLDPPKEDAAEAIRGLHELGVEVKVLTGDNEIVARTICEQVGIPVSRVLTGGQVERMSDSELAEAVRTVGVLAKLTPLQKARIVRTLQDSGKTVGFMGDGINDAAALLAADVGISVDTAVDIAKESANIILLEKSLVVLENGIVEGRGVYANIVKYIKITASSNFGNVFSILPASIFLPFLPMLPLQLLLLNLVYDLSSLALPFDRVDRDFVTEPKKWDASSLVRFMLFLGPVSSVYDLTTFFVMFFVFGASNVGHQAVFQSGWFVESMATQSLVVHMLRTDKIPFLQSRAAPIVMLGTAAAIGTAVVLTFTPAGHAIGLTPLPAMYWPILVLILAAYLLQAQAVKWAYKRRFGGEWL